MTRISPGTAGTVVLTEAISAGNLYFTNVTGNYYITNATGAETLTVGGTIDTGGGEHTIAAPISAGTLNKNWRWSVASVREQQPEHGDGQPGRAFGGHNSAGGVALPWRTARPWK